MKNIIIGIVGVFVSIYVVCIGLNIYAVQTHQNQLNHTVSRVVENTLKDLYGTEDMAAARNQLINDIKSSLMNEGLIKIEIKQMDLKKGLVQVLVTEEVPMVTGTNKKISVEKTAIMERVLMDEPKVTVQFMVDGEVYKEYQLAEGETCPIPKTPGNAFYGWVEYGKESMEPIQTIGAVWEDKIYLAVAR